MIALWLPTHSVFALCLRLRVFVVALWLVFTVNAGVNTCVCVSNLCLWLLDSFE